MIVTYISVYVFENIAT